MTTPLESAVEITFTKGCLAAGIWPIKIWPFGIVGFPDRMCLGPNALVFFVELKRPKGRGPSRVQEKCHTRLRKLGFSVFTIYTKDAVNAFLEEKTYLGVRD